MKKRINPRNFMLGLATGALIFPILTPKSHVEKKEKYEVKDYPSLGSNLREGPVYSSSMVPGGMCSRYVRLAAKDLFGINYPAADAWDVRDSPQVSEIAVKSGKELEEMAEAGIFAPGMLLGIYNPTSKYNEVAKQDGAGYTHIMLYLGREKGELFFADKFGKKTRTKISLKKLVEGGLEPREVLYLQKH